MKSLHYYARRDIKITDTPCPSPSSNEVLIKVTDAGLSQTQINEFIEGPFIMNSNPHPLTGIRVPIIPSQEYGGEIIEVGSDVSQDWVGKRVGVLPLIYCGKCEYCLSGQIHFCQHKAYYGLVGAHGGFCEYSAVNINNVIEVQQKDLLTFIEPLLVAIHGYHKYGQPLKNKSILILGAGAIGYACAAIWTKMGATDICIYDHLPNRLAKAAPRDINTVTEKNQLFNRFDVVIDAAGKDPHHEKQAFEEAPSFLKPGGAVISQGTYFFPMDVTPAELLINEKSFIPAYMYNQDDIALLKQLLLTWDISFDDLITRVKFENIIQEGYYQAELDRDTFVRIVTGDF